MNNNQDIWENKWSKLGEYSTKSAGNRWAFYLIKYLLNKTVESDGCIFDLGCGIGNKSAILAKYFPSKTVIGLDFSKEGIEIAKRCNQNIHNLSFETKDINDIDIKNHPIYMISSFECLEHIEDWQPVLAKMCEISDRYILLSVPTGKMRSYEIKMGHYRNFQKGELENFMTSHGYSIVDVLYAGFPFWSPLTRDILNHQGDSGDEMLLNFNPKIHDIMYFVYRNLTFKRIGDQFLGLFEKNI